MTDCIWILQSKITDSSRGVHEGDRFEEDELAAVDYIESGKAELFTRPERPPRKLYALLCEWITKIDVLGPEITSPDLWSAIDGIVFKDGLRRSWVGQASLTWYQGKSGLREMVGLALCEEHGHHIDLFRLFRRTTLPSISDPNDKYASYADEYARQRPGGRDDIVLDYMSPGYSEESRQFVFEALTLQADFENLLKRAISEGRIIVGQSATAGDRFIPPKAAERTSICDFDHSYWFAQSAELSASIVEKQIPLEAKRKRAADWAKRTHDHFSSLNQRFSSQDAKTVMRERFDLSENAAHDAWRKANIRLESGNIPQEQRVAISQLRQWDNI